MGVTGSGVTFTTGELDAIVRTLAGIARRHRVTDLATIVAYLASVSAHASATLTMTEQSSTITTSEYALAHGITDRAVRYRCEAQRLPARKVDGRWLIPVPTNGNPDRMRTNVE